MPEGFDLTYKEIHKQYVNSDGVLYLYVHLSPPSLIIGDIDETPIISTWVTDKSIIVYYDGEFYFNRSEIERILEIARPMKEVRRKIYSIGEPVKFLDRYGEPCTITITSVYYDTDNDGNRLFCINLLRDFGDANRSYSYPVEEFFDQIVTVTGRRIMRECFSTDSGAIAVKINEGETIKRVILRGGSMSGYLRTFDVERSVAHTAPLSLRLAPKILVKPLTESRTNSCTAFPLLIKSSATATTRVGSSFSPGQTRPSARLSAATTPIRNL